MFNVLDTMTGCNHQNCWSKQHLKDLHWNKNMKCNKAGSRMKTVNFFINWNFSFCLTIKQNKQNLMKLFFYN